MQPGSRLDHYEILSLLGRGGMGEVWRAQDTKLRREVAIKTLPPEFLRDADRLARLTREATSLAAVNHPNVAAIYGLEEYEDVRFLVLELVEGETVADRLMRGPIPTRQGLEIAAQIAAALEAAHERGVIHRDLKPANIKLMRDGRVKVLDFGLATSATHSGDDASVASTLRTQEGAIMGTAPYMSPEQVRGEPAGPQTDIWAFGVVLCEMLTGVSPFMRPTMPETIARVLETPVDLTKLPADLPLGARHLIRRCLEKDCARRFKHAGDVRIEAEDALADFSVEAKTARAHAGVSRRAALAGGAVFGLVGLGIGVGSRLMTGRRDEPPANPAYRRLTFRRGMIRTAQFAPDSQTVLYGALWDGDVCRVYMVRPESPESFPLSLPPAMPLAISAAGEVALSLGTHFRDTMTYGTLARVPLAGGAPRELLERVKYADWMPDGEELAVVRRVGAGDRLELSSGALLAEPETPNGGFSFVRVSPDGESVAAFELRDPAGLFGRVVIVSRSGVRRAASPRTYFNVFGLAWRGNEVLFTAADELPLFRNTVYAMDMSGSVRIVARVPGNASLHDIAPDGRVLIARTDDRGGITVRVRGEPTERDLSWLDEPWLADISSDGRQILFSETGVGGGARLSTYVRGTDGSPAVRLSDGFAQALSPDGRHALVLSGGSLDIVPTGAGQASRIERSGFRFLRARWLTDERRVVALAQRGGEAPRLYVLEVAGDDMLPVTPEGFQVGDGGWTWAVSPDGSTLAVVGASGVELFPLAGGASHVVPGSSPSFSVLGWIENGLLVTESRAAAGAVLRVDPATGQRSDWATIKPQDPTGVMNFFDVNPAMFVVAPDGRSYGYTAHRAISDLYLAEGWG